MTPPQIHAIIDHSLFNSQPPPPDPVDNLRNFSTDILMVLLARINAIIFNWGDEKAGRDEKIIEKVFDRLHNSVSQRLEFIRSFPPGKQSIIFNSPVIVTLMGRLVGVYRPFSNEEIINERKLEAIQWHLFNAILAMNEWYYNRVDDTDLFTYQHLWKLELAQQNYARGVRDIYDVNALRIHLFFRFMEERYGEKIGNEFANYFGVASPFNVHFILLKAITSASQAYEKDDQPRFWFAEKGLNEMLRPFTLDPARLPEKAGDAMTIINKPFYSYREGTLILDFDFFRQLAETSLIYYVYQATSLKQHPQLRNYNSYAAMLGKDFYEEYLAVQLFKKIFTQSLDKIGTDKEYKDNPDILLVQDNQDVFVIEIKSTQVHGSTLVRGEALELQEYLENNYAREKSQKGEKAKGIYQLKRQIQKLSAAGIPYRVYPVIIYTEAVLDIAGINSFLQGKMDKIMEEATMPDLQIHPLTLINLNFFIKYYPQLKLDRKFLKEMIHFYHQQKEARIKDALRDQDHWNYLHGQYSFIRLLELTHPISNRMDFFTTLADDFGFPLPKE